ncbi:MULTISPECIES: Fe(3+)-hydroxamate ABC transporter substrate-binding protein FhuD [Symbiopectobacterium]|uniref:Fe(3+)-hydroxamate ABC transporter substrate-binding protein FhuD n=1 Tax=Symbiopectobacterium TaxID=801 RepID=UPI001A318F2C|nr:MULTISPECIES: Fe(3+)-hydroxamate ABC transporter substrate-binding protein FhuD [Symbiopectobacterium]MBG6248660.1 Fe(3+)-hydroxamate ABC transporter substrate-binding protein FhuD [Candidatus Symbiopectobacterium sp. PLON1]MBT9428679.1 Fe(3+)-hydroxamate ABC transporter substrate-binding protein FhuD [Candidatus Symbiopectobacterium endolongispinus]
MALLSHRINYDRRRLLTALLLSPLCCSAWAKTEMPPDLRRIVALEWLPAELLLALGVMPLGVAEIPNYRLWVAEPQLPESVIDVGFRTEPNMELLAQLRPSLMLYSAGYGPSVEKMSRIAPTMGFSFNNDVGRPLTMAKASLRQLAQRLAIPDAAEQHLDTFSAFMQQARVQLLPYTRRPLLLFSFIDSTHVLIIAKNSLFQKVMDELGIENAWREETSFWGSVVVSVERLADIQDANAICFGHGDEAMMAQVERSPLWQALPFVRQHRWQRVPAVWLYGSTLSAMRFCQVLQDALEARHDANA